MLSCISPYMDLRKIYENMRRNIPALSKEEIDIYCEWYCERYGKKGMSLEKKKREKIIENMEVSLTYTYILKQYVDTIYKDTNSDTVFYDIGYGSGLYTYHLKSLFLSSGIIGIDKYAGHKYVKRIDKLFDLKDKPSFVAGDVSIELQRYLDADKNNILVFLSWENISEFYNILSRYGDKIDIVFYDLLFPYYPSWINESFINNRCSLDSYSDFGILFNIRRAENKNENKCILS